MQGIFVHDKRPKCKFEVTEAVLDSPSSVYLTTTNPAYEYQGSVMDAPNGEYYFWGADPRTKQPFFGVIVKKSGYAYVK